MHSRRGASCALSSSCLTGEDQLRWVTSGIHHPGHTAPGCSHHHHHGHPAVPHRRHGHAHQHATARWIGPRRMRPWNHRGRGVTRHHWRGWQCCHRQWYAAVDLHAALASSAAASSRVCESTVAPPRHCPAWKASTNCGRPCLGHRSCRRRGIPHRSCRGWIGGRHEAWWWRWRYRARGSAIWRRGGHLRPRFRPHRCRRHPTAAPAVAAPGTPPAASAPRFVP